MTRSRLRSLCLLVTTAGALAAAGAGPAAAAPGQLDRGFGGGTGFVTQPAPSAASVALQQGSDEIAVGGPGFRPARYDARGALDAAFSQRSDNYAGASAETATFDSSGRIVVAGARTGIAIANAGAYAITYAPAPAPAA